MFCFQGVEKECIWNKWFKELLEPKQSLNRAQNDDWYDAKNFLVQQFVGNKAKRRISKRQVTRKQITPNFPKKMNISYPQGHKEMFVFSENLACFIFLLPSFWDSPFCLITHELLKALIIFNSLTTVKFSKLDLFLQKNVQLSNASISRTKMI